MGREELLAALQELSDRRHGAAGWKPIYVIEQEILAKFKAEADKAESWARGLGEAQAELEQQKSKAESWARGLAHWRNKCIEAQVENEKLSTKVATLQSQLDFALSEPYHYSRDKAEYPWIRHEGKADGCPICNPPPSEKYHYAEAYPKSGLSMLHKGDKEDCPICNPKDHTAECAKILKMPPAEVEWLKKIEIEEADPKCEHKNLGLLALGGTQRCLDCHEWIIAKPFTQCPECHGTKYINRVVSCIDWELDPIYVIATCLNCKGEGVI